MARILVVQGHPDTRGSHLCHRLAEAYVAAAEEAGHQIRKLEIGRLEFPILRSKAEWDGGAKVPPAIARAQESVAWAEHILIVFPLWLGDMPALVKGFLEQLLRPGFAVKGEAGEGFEALLKGRTAHIVITMGMPAFVYRWYFRAHALRLLRRNILGLVGIRTTQTTLIGNVERLSEEQFGARIDELRRCAAAAG